jgi:plastocyanin
MYHLTAALFLLIVGPDASTGTIKGTVRYTGVIPDAQKVLTTDGQTILHYDLVVDVKTKGLRHVAVVLENAPVQPKLAKAKSVLVDQRDMLFIPRVVAVQHGQAVRFENNDLGNHSVMATSTNGANAFNVVAGPGQPIEHVFEPQKLPVQIGCSLHGWMRAWVYVLPHPWFALTDARGNFKIDRVPAGKYSVLLSHPDTGHRERREIVVRPGQTVELAIDWEKVGGKKK